MPRKQKTHHFFPPASMMDQLGGGAMFKLFFGRSPTRVRDRAFTASYIYSGAKIPDDMVRDYRKRGLQPQHIHALYESGHLIPIERAETAPPHQVQKWLRAVHEFLENPSRHKAHSEPRIFTSGPGVPATHLYILIAASICHLGSFVENYPFKRKIEVKELLVPFFAARALQLNRCIHRLVNTDETSELLALARGVYEAYVRILFCHKQPDLAAGMGLTGFVDNERFRYARKSNGRLDRTKIFDSHSGELIRCEFRIQEMVESANCDTVLDLHDFIYPLLCDEAHPSAAVMHDFLGGGEVLKIHRAPDMMFQLFFVSAVNLLLFEELSHSRFVGSGVRRDLNYHKIQLARRMLELMGQLPELTTDGQFKMFHEWLSKLAPSTT